MISCKEFERINNMKFATMPHKLRTAIFPIEQSILDPEFDHPQYYKGQIDGTPVKVLLFHNYGDPEHKFVEAGFQILSRMYHENAVSYGIAAKDISDIILSINRLRKPNTITLKTL